MENTHTENTSPEVIQDKQKAALTRIDIRDMVGRLESYLEKDGQLNEARVELERAQGDKILVIKNDEMKAEYINRGVALKKISDELDESRKELKNPINQLGKLVDNTYNGLIKDFKAVMDQFKLKITDYNKKQEEIEAEKQRKLEEKLEAQRKAALEKAEEELETADSEEERQAIQEKVQEIENAPPAPVLPTQGKTTKTDTGAAATTKKIWNLEITDEKEFLKSIASGKFQFLNPEDLISYKKSGLKSIAKIMKNQIKVPGCRTYEESQTSFR